MKEEVTKKDPVCGMEVEEGNEAARYEYQGKIYLFCSKHCAEEFKEEPEKYLESV